MDIQLPALIDYSQLPTAVPYPTQILRQKPWYEFVRHNGYQKLAKRLMVKVFSNISSAEDLWNEFTPNDTLFDLWEIRSCFHSSYKIDPYFITLYEENRDDMNILGVLPIWYEPEEQNGKYQWFGGYWPERNSFFVRDLEIIPLLLMVAPRPLSLTSIDHRSDYDFLKMLVGYRPETDENYYLDLTKMSNLNAYFSQLKKKKRHNLKRDRKRIIELHPNIVYDNPEHLERMYELNIERFARSKGNINHEPSIYVHEADREVFRTLVRNTSKADMKIISTVINGIVEAVEVGFVYNKVWYAMTSGANIMRYSGLGVYSNLLVIEEAIKTGCVKIDFMQEDHNWKEAWQLNSTQFYTFDK